MTSYQFTMWSSKGNAPVSCIVEANSRLDFASDTIYRRKAILAICTKRGWSKKDLEKFGYTTFKVRNAPAPKVKPIGTIQSLFFQARRIVRIFKLGYNLDFCIIKDITLIQNILITCREYGELSEYYNIKEYVVIYNYVCYNKV